ncbi:MAG: hypothetical protein Q9214_007888, partial [Letrouitia sp. 1 TL-2023]
DEDLVASKTDGFKVGEKKTVEEYAKLGESSANLLYDRCQIQLVGITLRVTCLHIRSYIEIMFMGITLLSNESHFLLWRADGWMTNLFDRADQNDESLNRWKASLGISNSPALPVDPSDTRRCIIRSLALEVEGRQDITIDLTSPGSLESLRTKPFTIKEGSKFRMKANFKVQHDVLSGLKYLQVVKRFLSAEHRRETNLREE